MLTTQKIKSIKTINQLEIIQSKTQLGNNVKVFIPPVAVIKVH